LSFNKNNDFSELQKNIMVSNMWIYFKLGKFRTLFKKIFRHSENMGKNNTQRFIVRHNLKNECYLALLDIQNFSVNNCEIVNESDSLFHFLLVVGGHELDGFLIV